MSLIHWNYFLALEDDFKKLSRYVEFNLDNQNTYSIEMARILMTSTQEVDVLLKEICAKHGNKSDNEQGYRNFICRKYPKLLDANIEILGYELECDPFSDWKESKTPDWWTANNKIKHFRNKEFSKAKLKNAIMSMAALLVVNIYYYLEVKNIKEIYPNPKFLYPPHEMITSITPTSLGNLNNYKLL